MHDIAGALALLEYPLSINSLSKLLRRKQFLVHEDIKHLSAVLVVPDSPDEPVTIFHPSFRDYLLTCCTDKYFRVDAGNFNAFIADRCLYTMNQHLRKDICNIGDPSILNEEVENLDERRNSLIPLELRYACEYWMTHLSNAKPLSSEGLEDKLKSFCECHLLHWVEALSLLNKISAGAFHLPAVIMWCKHHFPKDENTVSFLLEDVERVVLTYSIPIQAGAIQVYCSALLFMPTCPLYQAEKQKATGRI